jgi:ribulose-5-phosphate 4-epimerase/fuculose-1-phosphate aldolase
MRDDPERQARIDLAACYRLVALFGWDDLIFTHISVRVPGPEHHFLINPYGMLFEEITASSLVKIDLDGRKVGESPYDVNPAGFNIHSAIHAAREDAKCVLHLHSLDGIAVSTQPEGLLPVSQQSIFVLASLAYHDYEGVALNEEERPRLVRDLGDKNKAAARPACEGRSRLSKRTLGGCNLQLAMLSRHLRHLERIRVPLINCLCKWLIATDISSRPEYSPSASKSRREQ